MCLLERERERGRGREYLFVFICVYMRLSGINSLLLRRAKEAAATAATAQQLLQHTRVLLRRGEREREKEREREHMRAAR
jgi:hypothetical protein